MSYYILKGIGLLLSGVRAGDTELITNLDSFRDVPMNITIISKEIKDGYLVDITAPIGGNKSPSLEFTVPANDAIKSLVIVCQDIDPPVFHPITHLLAYNIPAHTSSFKLGELNYNKGHDPSPMKFGYGFYNRIGYFGPGPPPGHGAHRYVFQIFAVNDTATQTLNNYQGIPKKDVVLKAISGNTVSMGQIMGNYKND